MASPEAGPCHNKSEGKDPNPSTPSKEDPDRILDFDGPGDQRNPYNWSPARKWLIAGVSLVGTLVLVQNGTSITVAAHQISEEFNVSDTAEFTNTYWTVTSWTLGGAIAVPIVLSLLEDFGVCVVYLVAYLLFLCFLIPQAVASNYATLVVTRFFAGCFAASLPNTIASMIPDMWSTDAERSLPISIYIFFYVGGTTLGAPAFAPIIQYVGNWRW
jgi:MFS family permease